VLAGKGDRSREIFGSLFLSLFEVRRELLLGVSKFQRYVSVGRNVKCNDFLLCSNSETWNANEISYVLM
jgi:hypothetical protein